MTDETRSVGKPQSFKDAKELWLLCKSYFDKWEADNRPLTVVGLSVYLNVSRQTLSVYESGIYDTEGNEYSDTVKKAKDYIECIKWEAALTGRYDKTVAIFDLKVNHKAIEYDKSLGVKPDEDDKEGELIGFEEHDLEILNRFGIDVDKVESKESK